MISFLAGLQVCLDILYDIVHRPVAHDPVGRRAEGAAPPAAPAYLHNAAWAVAPRQAGMSSPGTARPLISGNALASHASSADIGKIACLAQVDDVHAHLLSHGLPGAISAQNHGGLMLPDQRMFEQLQETWIGASGGPWGR